MKQSFLNVLGGAVTSVSPFLQPENSATILNGVNVSYRLGAMLKDTGYSRVGNAASASKAITGLHNFRQDSSTQKILRTKNNDAGTNLLLQYNNSGTWTDINVSTTYDAFEDSQVEMEDFIGYCFVVGYDSTDGVFLPIGSLTGTTFSTATNVTGAPNAKYIKRYRDRLYLANCYYSGAAYQYRVYYSDAVSAGSIAWTGVTATTGFFDVDFSEAVIGIAENWDRLIVFTEYSAYFWDQTQRKKLWDTGCSNHRTIATSGAYMIWANFDGVWNSTGGQPENIAMPVIDFIRAGNPRNFVAKLVDEEYNLFVGNVTVNGISYSNCLLTYNIPTSTWRWRELGHSVTVMERFNSSGTQRLYLGTSIGEVYDKCKYTDATLINSDGYIDANNKGVPIHSNFELSPISLSPSGFGSAQTVTTYSNSKSTVKNLQRITTFANRAMGLKLRYRVLDKEARVLTPYTDIGEVTRYVQHHHIGGKNGVFLQIAGYEYGMNPYWSFYGFEIEYDNISDVLDIE